MKASAFKMAGGEFIMRKYGLTKTQAERFLSRTAIEQATLEKAHEMWRAKHGFPAANSPISRATFLAFLNEVKLMSKWGIG
jgi:hypothetical protein